MPEIKERWSPNKEKFSKLLKEAMADYDDYDESQRRPVDYSFLYEDPEERRKKAITKQRRKRIKKIAVIVIIAISVLALIASVIIWIK